MSESLDRTAEIAKLARLLDVEPAELAYLEELPSSALSAFRAQLTDRLFAGDAGRLKRVAAASKLVPIPLTVKISQLAFGPVLCAATAGLLDPPHAVKVASKVPTDFLADITIHLDPRRAASVIAVMPEQVVVRVAVELLRRGEHVTMGRFVNFLPAATLRAAVPRIEDEADLLRVAFVMEGKDSLDALLDIARPRLQKLIDAAYREDMWAEALDLITNLSLENRAELADFAAGQPGEVLDSLIRAAHRLGTWDALLPLTAAMSAASLQRFAEIPAVLEPAVLDDILAVALDGPLWLDLLPLVHVLPDAALRRVAGAVATRDDADLERLAEQAHSAGRWDALLRVALALDAPTRVRLAALPLFARPDVLSAAIGVAAEHDLWDEALPLATALPIDVRPHLATCLGELTQDQMLSALDAARRSDDLVTLIEIALGQEQAGRRRVIELVASVDRVDEFAALLDADTPDVVWDALVEVRDEIPDGAREVLLARAAELGHDDVVTAVTPVAPATRPRPRPGR